MWGVLPLILTVSVSLHFTKHSLIFFFICAEHMQTFSSFLYTLSNATICISFTLWWIVQVVYKYFKMQRRLSRELYANNWTVLDEALECLLILMYMVCSEAKPLAILIDKSIIQEIKIQMIKIGATTWILICNLNSMSISTTNDEFVILITRKTEKSNMVFKSSQKNVSMQRCVCCVDNGMGNSIEVNFRYLPCVIIYIIFWIRVS